MNQALAGIRIIDMTESFDPQRSRGNLSACSSKGRISRPDRLPRATSAALSYATNSLGIWYGPAPAARRRTARPSNRYSTRWSEAHSTAVRLLSVEMRWAGRPCPA